MPYTKTVFTDMQTVITSSFLNGLQDQVINNENSIDNLRITNELSGNVVHITDAENNMPFRSIKTSFSHVQSYNGFDKPWASGEGKNKINAEDITLTEAGDIFNGAISLEAGTYTLSSSNTTVPVTILGITGAMPITFSVSESTSSLQITATEAGEFNDIQIENGGSATTYEPYLNECPITGKTGIVLSKSTNGTSNPTTHNFQWTSVGTVYDATVDFVTGNIVATTACINSYNGETLTGRWSSSLDSYEAGKTPTIGAQVVYELASPTTLHANPINIVSSLGENNIWCDSGDVQVEYYANTKLYIDNKFQELEDIING